MLVLRLACWAFRTKYLSSRQYYLPVMLPKPMCDSVTLYCMKALVVQDAVQEFITCSIALPDSLDVSVQSLQYALIRQAH